ncbi:MAG: chemotaxis protein CheC [Hydrogenibacillus schlegelii]|nr:chemotaxis protein CheC [Hydrogenibacillus schlegelii]
MNGIGPLSDFHLDLIREIGNIGAAHATTSLAKLTGTRIEMSVPSARLLRLADVGALVGEERTVAAAYLAFGGDIEGSIFLLFPPDGVRTLLRRLLPGIEAASGEEDGFSPLEWSAFKEVGNILAGSLLSALADFTGLRIVPGVPDATVDMGQAILVYGLLEAGKVGDVALVIDAEMKGPSPDEAAIEAKLFLFPSPDALETIFRALGVSGP